MSHNRLSPLPLLFLFCSALHAADPLDVSLHKAVLKNDAELVTVLIGQGVSVEQRDNDGMTPMFRAAYKGYDQIVRLLLAAQADPNARDKWDNTPIFLAAAGGRITTLELLIENGARIDATNAHLENPLYSAVRNDKASVAQFLLEHGADPNVWAKGTAFAPLHYAAMRADPDLLEALLAAGSQVNAKGELGATPLHMAAAHGRPSAVDRLSAAGADVNARADTGATPLHYALTFGYTNVPAVISTLLRNGADPNLVDDNGESPMDVAKDKKVDPAVMAVLAGQTPAVSTNALPSAVNPSPVPTDETNVVLQKESEENVAPLRESPEPQPIEGADHGESVSNVRALIIGGTILVGLVILVFLLRRRRGP